MSQQEELQSEKIRGKGVAFDRIRRITGYLVGGMPRWNSAKKAEEHDRVKHGTSIFEEVTENKCVKVVEHINA